MIAAIGVMPMPAETSTSGPSESPSTRSPEGCDNSRTAPGRAFSYSQFDTAPGGTPSVPRTRLMVTRSESPRGPDEMVYCRGCRSPPGRSTAIATYWPVRCAGMSPRTGASSSENTSSDSSKRSTTR